MLTVANLSLPTLCCVLRHQEAAVDLTTSSKIDDLIRPCFHSNITSLDLVGLLLELHGYRPSVSPGLSVNHSEFLSRQCLPSTSITLSSPCHQSPTTLNLLFFTFWLLVIFVALTGNSIVCLVVYKSTFLRSKMTNYFIVSLAVSDLLVAIVVLPIRQYFVWHNYDFCGTIELCRLYYTTDIIFFTASITNLFAIAADRYLALTKPYRYMETMTTKRALLAIALVWMYALVWGALFNFDFGKLSHRGIYLKNNQCSHSNGPIVTVLYIMVLYVPLTLMGFAYARILRIAIAHAHSIAASHSMRKFLHRQGSSEVIPSMENSSSGNNNTSSANCIKRPSRRRRFRRRAIHPELKATKTVIVVYGTFFMCFFPLSVITLLSSWYPDGLHFTRDQWYFVLFVDILPFLNSTMNPFIYGIMNSHFREGFVALFGTVKRYFGNYSVGLHRSSTKITQTSETVF